jgi:hypothetical protein
LSVWIINCEGRICVPGSEKGKKERNMYFDLNEMTEEGYIMRNFTICITKMLNSE